MTTRIGVILASVREGRRGAAVADWVLRHAKDREAEYELIDLAEHPLPHFGEPFPPMMGRYRDPSTRDWAAVIAGFDAFVIVTAEYNHGVPSSLKNAIDHLYAEWAGKVVGFVGYGVAGGVRAIDQLRVLAGAVHMAAVGPQVELPVFTAVGSDGVVADERLDQQARAVLDAVEKWSAALSPLRTAVSS